MIDLNEIRPVIKASHKSRSSGCPKVLIMMTFVIPLAVFNSAAALEWANDYSTSATLGADDNFRLSEDDELDTTWLDLGVVADVRGASEISAIRLALGINHASYSESSIEDEKSYNLALETSRTGERIDSFFNAVFASELTTETELLDSGLTEEDGTRDSIILTPGFAYRIDERNTLSGTINLEDVNYSDVDLTEYSEESLQLGWRYQLNESSSFSAGLEYRVYDPDDDDETDINSLNIGYRWQMSQATRYDISAGYTDVERPDDSEDGSNFAFSIDHESDERNRFNLALSNSYESSGSGDVREEDRLDLRWAHTLSERTQTTVSAEGVSTDDRDYYSITFGGSYQYTPEVSFSASYRYRERDEDSESAEGSENADSSTLLFSLSYSPL